MAVAAAKSDPGLDFVILLTQSYGKWHRYRLSHRHSRLP